jgi:hypothetical protein
VKNTITNKIKNVFVLINDWITNHLGKNPTKGGSPPKDKKGINRKNFT